MPATLPHDDALARPFPIRRAAAALHERLVAHLRRARPAPGDLFLTDADLVRLTGLSRSTVRRALDKLSDDGWISREVGRGTFVGPRVALRDGPLRDDADDLSTYVPTAELPAEGDAAQASVTRVAVMIFNIADLASDWYTPAVLDGIDAAAESVSMRVELLGVRESGVEQMARRLEQSRPDVLVCLASQPPHVLVLRDAQRLGIPVVTASTSYMEVWPATVSEDNQQGMQLAFDRLRAAGHRRIGLLIGRGPGTWFTERQATFLRLCEKHDLAPGEADTLWLDDTACDGSPVDDAMLGERVDRVERLLDRHRPTAVICGHYVAADTLSRAVRRRGLRVPGDLSVVSFDQHPLIDHWFGLRVERVHLPLREMGRRLAALAKSAAEGGVLSRAVRLSCELVAGESVAPPASAQIEHLPDSRGPAAADSGS